MKYDGRYQFSEHSMTVRCGQQSRPDVTPLYQLRVPTTVYQPPAPPSLAPVWIWLTCRGCVKHFPFQTRLLQLFHEGKRHEFLVLWNQTVPDAVRTEEAAAQKLEFYLNIYFAIYPLKYDKEVTTKTTMFYRPHFCVPSPVAFSVCVQRTIPSVSHDL